MNTAKIDILNTQYALLSTIPKCEFVDHYVFLDPVSGSNIYYPITAYGERLDPNTEYLPTWILSSGPLAAACYQDFCFAATDLSPFNIYCNTDVTFILSAFDETISEITKIIYDFGDGSEFLEVNYNFASNPPTSPKDIPVTKTYYPTDKHITSYFAHISVVKNDSCVNTLKIPICAFKCGIFDTYDDITVLNSQISNPTTHVFITLEKKLNDQIFHTLLLTNEPTTIIGAESALQNVVNPVETARLLQQTTTRISSPIPPTNLNPVVPPVSYLYSACVGIDLNLSVAELVSTQSFYLKNVSLILSGEGAPYIGGTGITVGYECPPYSFPTTKVPSTPFIFNITSPSLSSILVYFSSENDGSSATNYEFSIDNGVTYNTFTPPQTSSPLLIENGPNLVIEPGTTYYVVIRGTNINGTGSPSNLGIVTTLGYILAFDNTYIITFNNEPVSLL
jgi:hypothetical protein